MTELSNEDDLVLTPKLPENKNYRFNKSPLLMPTLSKVIKKKTNNNLLQNSQKIQREKEQLFLDYHRNSINNINNYRTQLPNIITSLTPIERRINHKGISILPKNKSIQGIRNNIASRNYENIFFENDQLNNTFQLKRFNQLKNNKYSDMDNEMNLSQIFYKKNKNMNSNNLYSRNIDNISNKNNLNSNYLTQNNINNINSNKNNYNKMKFTINKKNLMHTIKKPSKINLEKKNFKYKIPIDVINNYNYGKKKILNDMSGEQTNNSRLNLRQRSNKSYSMKKNKDIINCNNIDMQNNEKEDMNINDPKAFIESTLIAFNGLVSQAQELGQILIDNKEMLNSKNRDEMGGNNVIENNENNVNSKLNKLNQEINNEHKTVEELQKINSDLNNKINLFNKNTQKYENKVKELVTVINQIKNNNNNNNNVSNSNSNSDNFSNGIANNTNNMKKDNNSNFMLENKPKKKKLKFGFVELIFMKDDKFEMIHKPKPPKYQPSKHEFLTINKSHKDPKLVFVNINKSNNSINNEGKVTNDEYLDAASQMANHLIIESLISLEKEDENEDTK